jgi:hypothetical protein
MSKDRRLGAFKISRRLIDECPQDALAILDGCLVLRAECLLYDDTVEYYAIHPEFDHVPEYQPIPVYVATVSGGKRCWRKPDPVPAHLLPVGWHS